MYWMLRSILIENGVRRSIEICLVQMQYLIIIMCNLCEVNKFQAYHK